MLRSSRVPIESSHVLLVIKIVTLDVSRTVFEVLTHKAKK